ncbi:MAG: hypothetical protein WA921_08120 [Ahrensia sp.]
MLSQSDTHPQWQPLHFLASLGAGGLVVTFFMYIMWMTPHAGQPIPSFSTLRDAFLQGDLLMQALIVLSVTGIAVFSVMHYWLLGWNIKRFSQWAPSEQASAMRAGNAGSSIMAAPLTFAMAVNVGFIVGAVFVPGLWQVAEYLFPLALVAFGAIGVYALRIFGRFMTDRLVEGGFDCAKNNSLAQMLSVFAFAMVGVGFSAGAAMSQNQITSIVGFAGASLFITTAILFGALFFVMGMRSMFENKANPETVPTLWVVIPFVTVVGIALYRMNMALEHNFGVEWEAGSRFFFLITLFSIQLIMAFVGYGVIRRTRYFATYVYGPEKSAGAFALICPGVALFVFANFVINPGLVGLGVLAKFSLAYFALYAPLVALQLFTIIVFLKLTTKLISGNQAPQATLSAAE